MAIRIIRSSIKESTIFFSHSGEDPHDQSGLQAQDHQERAALHGLGRRRGRQTSCFSFSSLPLLVEASCVAVLILLVPTTALGEATYRRRDQNMALPP